MCTETFLRLPAEKRSRFLDAAWDEFTRVPFADVSINKIILQARIPRGSFYQYFENKEALFQYLQHTALEYLISEYAKYLETANGDFFRTQLICFDRIASFGSISDPLFDRYLRVIRLNPGLLPQVVMEEKLMLHIFNHVWETIDTASLHTQDKEFVAHAFGLSLIALAIAVAACLTSPDQADTHRRSLQFQLDIIKNGSLASESQKTM